MAEFVTISDGTLTGRVDLHGAQLVSLAGPAGEYLWQGNARWWGGHSPILFPIVGTLRDGRASSAQGPVALRRHGLARDNDFVVVDKADSSVTLRLESSPETRKLFPFDFRLEMTYALADGALAQTFAVTNTGDVTLPFTLGGHPAFNVPAPGATDAFEDYRVEFAEKWTYSVPAMDLKTGLIDNDARRPLLEDSDTLPLTHRLFDHDALVLEDVPGRTVRLVGPEGHGVQVDFDGFDYLGIWSAQNDAPFVAVEPWRGTATTSDEDDTFESKRGTDLLEPGEEAAYTFVVRPL